ASAKACALALPNPLAPPVTTAAMPGSIFIGSFSHCHVCPMLGACAARRHTSHCGNCATFHHVIDPSLRGRVSVIARG
ncbi:MAG: hypothetical protein U0975_04995, partial [Erythrobacter sp.]|nr:hypothetical protein [Erythrobacter sp.]